MIKDNSGAVVVYQSSEFLNTLMFPIEAMSGRFVS